MKSISLILLFIIIPLSSCNKSEQKREYKNLTTSLSTQKPLELNLLKKAGCNSEEDLKKKLDDEIKKAEKPKAMKLQGSTSGCSIEE